MIERPDSLFQELLNQECPNNCSGRAIVAKFREKGSRYRDKDRVYVIPGNIFEVYCNGCGGTIYDSRRDEGSNNISDKSSESLSAQTGSIRKLEDFTRQSTREEVNYSDTQSFRE